jgi:chemotaxis protein CheX
MQFLEEEILEITEATWTAMLGMEIARRTGSGAPDGATSFLNGHVGISGAWEGQVMIHGTSGLARSAASKIFSIAPEEVSEQDEVDAIYELTNIIAGNIKSLLPEPCQLSLPEVHRGTEWAVEATGADCVSELSFESEGHVLQVAVWKRELSKA